jgi:hypothetical protein
MTVEQNKADRFFLTRLFQVSLILTSKAVTYLSESPSNLLGSLLKNIRLGWKGLPGTNAQAYFKHSQIKKFITLDPASLG